LEKPPISLFPPIFRRIKPKEASSSEEQQDLHGKKRRGEGVKDNRPYWP
jgi:hypothetical protein